VKTVVAGNPLSVTWKFALAAVTVPDESWVKVIVIVAVPLPLVSVPVAPGTSLAGERASVKVAVCEAVVGVLLLLQAATLVSDTARHTTENLDNID
jgi:hypothetical protein